MTAALPLKPSIRSSRELKRYDFQKFRATLFDQIVSYDLVEYSFILILYDKATDDPVMYLTSEKNTSPFGELFANLGIAPEAGEESAGGSGSHYFCVFDIDGHSNYGASDDWGDVDKFEQKFLEDIQEGLAPR